ncbi:hypothetical protein [Mycobacterium sp. ACS4331]|uniref:Rv0361 family membrane protein n=1 Tax=Mycobacterium sp. ACS4331 TaxID=1834121 RepID=UPI0007FBA392|nr:hypothetical protein [Mycobacterium sp. ACS4331]OBF23764.1 hypothetical protein A5727_00365 [Mycobacterium sp. ACS4331]
MAGPYPPPQGTDVTSVQPVPPGYGPGYPGPAQSYPGPLPPPVPYPAPRRGRRLLTWLVVLAAVAGLVAAVVWAARDEAATTTTGVINDSSAKTAIQNYLDALSDKDLQTISRNTLCGLYDGVRDRRSDDALAKLSADAFNKQFSRAEVTSVDQIVFASPASAQVLFSMRVTPARGTRGPEERQGVAQLLTHNNQILVCSYVMRTAGAF